MRDSLFFVYIRYRISPVYIYRLKGWGRNAELL